MGRGLDAKAGARALIVLALTSALLAGLAADVRAAGVTVDSSSTFLKGSKKSGIGSIPDLYTVYWLIPYVATNDVKTVIRGQVPNARLWGYTLYKSLASPVDNLDDSQAQTRDGRYTITVARSCRGVANCLDASKSDQPLASQTGFLVFGLYDPIDLGTTESGGVPMPKVSFEDDSPGQAADVSQAQLPSSVRAAVEGAQSAVLGTGHGVASSPGPFDGPVGQPDNDPPPQPRVLTNTADAYFLWLGERGLPSPVADSLVSAKHQFGGFGALDMSFPSNRYLAVTFDTRRGDLLLRFRSPTYARSAWEVPRNGLARRGGREQLRYWSLCTNDADLWSQGCLRDSDAVVGRDRQVTLIVSPSCPVAGYDNCVVSGNSMDPNFIVVLSNLLPAAGFSPFTGRYAVSARYVARPAPAPAPATAAAPSSSSRRARIARAQIRRRRVSFRLSGPSLFACALTRRTRRGWPRASRFRACHSPVIYAHLRPGRYRFFVRARGPGGVDRVPARRSFTVH